MKRRYITSAVAERMRTSIAVNYRPTNPEQLPVGCLGHVFGAEYYVVPDDDPRAGTEETVDA